MTAPHLKWGTGLLDTVQISASFTVGPDNHEQVIQSVATADITLTFPNDLPQGFALIVDQAGAGAVIFAAATGASLVNRSSFDRTAGAGAMMNAYVRWNTTGRSAVVVLGGDGAAA